MFEIFVITICILMNGFLASFETAFIAVSRPVLRLIAKDKASASITKLLQLKENPERTLSVIQVGISFVGVFAAAVGGAGAEKLLRPIYQNIFGLNEEITEILAIFTITAPLTYLTVVFGELIPKTFALRKPLKLASRHSRFIQCMIKILFPIVIILEYSTKYILRLFPKRIDKEAKEPEKVLEGFATMSDLTKEYALNLIEVEKSKISSVMIPWDRTDCLQMEHTIDEVENIIIQAGHTRFPVFEKSEVLGILNSKECLALLKSGRNNWASIIRKALVLYDQTPLLIAFRLMQKERVHMAIVRDIYGMTKGVVTMEDIFEEIFGEIYDEDDEGSILQILSKIKK